MVTIYRYSIFVNSLLRACATRHRNPSTSELVQQGHTALRRALEKPVISLLGRRPTCTARDNPRLPDKPSRSVSKASPAHRRGNAHRAVVWVLVVAPVGQGVEHSVRLSVRRRLSMVAAQLGNGMSRSPPLLDPTRLSVPLTDDGRLFAS
jgi:hypothetical protein